MISKRAAQILMDLKGSPYKTPDQLAQSLEVSPDSIYRYLQELEKEYLIVFYHSDDDGVLIEGRKHRGPVYVGLISDLDRVDAVLAEFDLIDLNVTTRAIDLSTETTPPSLMEMRYRKTTEKLCHDIYGEILDEMSFTELQLKIDQFILDDSWRPMGLGPLREMSGLLRQLEAAGWISISRDGRLKRLGRDDARLWEIVTEYRRAWLLDCAAVLKNASSTSAGAQGRRENE